MLQKHLTNYVEKVYLGQPKWQKGKGLKSSKDMCINAVLHCFVKDGLDKLFINEVKLFDVLKYSFSVRH